MEGHRSTGEAALVASLLVLLAVAIVYPLIQVLSVAFVADGAPTVRPLLAFFGRPLFREALVNTLLAGGLAVWALRRWQDERRYQAWRAAVTADPYRRDRNGYPIGAQLGLSRAR